MVTVRGKATLQRRTAQITPIGRDTRYNIIVYYSTVL